MKQRFKAGDKVRRLTSSEWPGKFGHVGETYTVLATKLEGSLVVVTVGGATTSSSNFELVEEEPMIDTSNPNETPWEKMTPEEKGALLLAHHEGKTIQYWSLHFGQWLDTLNNRPSWAINLEYRVKPEPKVETVELWTTCGTRYYNEFDPRNDKYKITYQTVDGKPDWSTLKGETL